jgi:hypothetical protein
VTEVGHLLLGFAGTPFSVGESTLTLGGFSEGCQQQTLALIQIIRQKVGVIHHAHCCTDFCQSRKSVFEKFLTNPTKASSPAPRSQIESGQQSVQLAFIQFDTLLTTGGLGQLEGSGFQTLVKNRQTVVVPKQNLEPIALATNEQEQVARERVFVEDPLGQPH